MAAAASVPLKERATVFENCRQCFMGQLDNERLGVCEGREGPQLHTDSREVNWGSNPAGFSTSHAHGSTHTLKHVSSSCSGCKTGCDDIILRGPQTDQDLTSAVTPAGVGVVRKGNCRIKKII